MSPYLVSADSLNGCLEPTRDTYGIITVRLMETLGAIRVLTWTVIFPYAVSALRIALLEEEETRNTEAQMEPFALWRAKFGRVRREAKIPSGGSNASGIVISVSMTQVPLIGP
jgi:hypothetical protein